MLTAPGGHAQGVTVPRSLENIMLPTAAMAAGSWYSDRANHLIHFKPSAADVAAGIGRTRATVISAVGTTAASTALLELDGVDVVEFDGVGFAEGGGWAGASTPLGYTETQAAYHASYGPNFNGLNDSAWVRLVLVFG